MTGVYSSSSPSSVSTGTEDGVPFVRLHGVDRFDVRQIFDCGQCFRFLPVPGTPHEAEFGGTALGKYISVAQDGNDVTVYGTDGEEFGRQWRAWLGLDTDYAAAAADILSRSDVPALRTAVEYGRGIRILRQDPWEALCTFILSQNNNIPRIRGLVAGLSRALGEPFSCPGMRAHGADAVEYAFPSPGALAAAGPEVLYGLKTGFRAGYLDDAARRVCGGSLDLSAVARAPSTAAASALLQSVRGVGPKVAACTLLFGFGRMDAFPVDVWIRRVISRYFPGEFDAAALGPWAGLAQQYMFYYERGNAR